MVLLRYTKGILDNLKFATTDKTNCMEQYTKMRLIHSSQKILFPSKNKVSWYS